MANSRSNIYPIQLQGAELNLNKLDAEIKQYSGFNKNNSPFVGGCLSNVFTKEGQITGGNADNTYIDSNGDVYRVDTEGLYQNENKIISYDSTVKFYQKRKLKMPVNAVKAISEDIYITEEINYLYTPTSDEANYEYVISGKQSVYVAHWGDGHSQVLAPACVSEVSYVDIQKKGDFVVFSAKNIIRTTRGGNAASFLYMICIPDCNEAINYWHRPNNSDLQVLDVCSNITSSRINYIPKSMAVFIDNDNTVYMCGNSYHYSWTPLWVSTNGGQTFSTYYEFSASVSSPYFINTEIPNYFMTSDGYFYLVGLTSEMSSPDMPTRKFVFSLSSDQTAYIYYKIKIRMVNGQLKFVSGCYFNAGKPGSSTYIFRRLDDSYTQNLTSGYAFYTVRITKGSDEDYLSICDSFKNVTYSLGSDDPINKNFIVTGGTYFKDGFKILINNGTVSNISIAEYTTAANGKQTLINGKSFNGVVIEDWNTIKDFAIYDGKCVYTTYNNELYIVEPTEEPKLSLKLNQVVVNCNNEYNSYHLASKKILHYGSDWNCSYLDSNVNIVIRAAVTANNCLVASAVNEYDEENNPSMLMNMQAVYFYYSGSVILWPVVNFDNGRINISDFVKNYMISGAVNFYINPLADNKAVYHNSACIGYYNNEDLAGLPFPNNTDGNVQYNPNLFSEFIQNFGTDVFVKNGDNSYQLIKDGQTNIMAYFLGTLIENLEVMFILQGQYYGIMNNKLFALQYSNGVVSNSTFIVNIQGLQFVGNTPYEALFFSKTNRCLYSFTGANVLSQKQLVDKISEVRNYLYNPATQTVFLITDIGVLFYGLFGMFLLEYTDITNIFLLDNGIVLSDNNGNYRYIKYYLDEGDEDYTKENIRLETCFYGMNNEMVTINDCLYFRLFSEDHEEGQLKVSATTISLQGRQTEETTFNIKASDWDKITHTIYLRYQPKTQRGLGVSFSIDSPFKIASMSVGSQPDAVLVDKLSKKAITAPSVTSNNDEW